MNCDKWLGLTTCPTLAKWWFRASQHGRWHPRCGVHAKMPGNTKRERVPITQEKPLDCEPLPVHSLSGRND